MITRTRAILAATLLCGAPASAQLPQASAAALGMGFNMTASARGFAAVANNPAGLAHWASPRFSIAIPAAAVSSGAGPVTVSDLSDWEGELVPTAVKEDWLAKVTASGGQNGRVALGATPVALSLGRLGFQLSTAAGGAANLNADAAELLLFGNAGQVGSARDYRLEGSALDGFVLTTAALSYGIRPTDRLYLGLTGKYTMGNALVVGRDAGSLVGSDPLEVEVRFPVMMSRSGDGGLDHGSGLGMDLGLLWEGRAITVGAMVENVFHTFSWNLDGLSYIPGEVYFATGGSSSDFQEQPASAAPASFREMVEGLTLKPVFAVGAELDLPSVRLQADIRKRVPGGLALGPDFHAGVGAEFKALYDFPIRAHLAAVTGGIQAGGGATLIVGPVHLSGAGAYRTGQREGTWLGMVTLSFGAH